MLELSESEKRFLLSFLGTFLLSLYLSLSKNKLLHIPSSIAILFIAYSLDSIAILFTIIAIAFTLVLIFHDSKYIAHTLMFFHLGCIVLYKRLYEQASLDICGVIMVFTIKFFYLGKEYKNNKSIKDAMIYLFQLPGIMAGPVQSYSSFMKNDEIKKIRKGMIIVFQSILFLIIHSLLRTKFDLNNIVYYDNFIVRLVYAIIATTVIKCKYYFVWTFAYGCFVITGVDNLKNVFPLSAEFSASIKELQGSWNVYTNAWLKQSVFVPLKRFGFFNASLATFFISALWHGTNPCYFVMFLTFSLCVPLLNNNVKVLHSLFSPVIANFLSVLQMMLFSSFFAIPFFLLDYVKLLEVWTSLYFYGYAIIGCSIALYVCTALSKRRIVVDNK